MSNNPICIFEGLWSLKKFTKENKDTGNQEPVMGDMPTGYLMYNSGHMTVQMLHENHANTSDVSFFAYAGRYTFDKGNIYHHLEMCSQFDWIGRTVTRKYSIDNNTLKLEADEKINDIEYLMYLTWERI